MNKKLSLVAASFFGIGFLPLAPGSLASVAGVLVYFFLRQNTAVYVLLFVVITVTGFIVSDRAEKILGRKDPSVVVIDEVSGVMIAFFLLPMTWPVVWTAFFLFRAFDMFKITPVDRFEKMPGGVGIMMDDIIAGIYTNLVMQVAVRLAGMVQGQVVLCR